MLLKEYRIWGPRERLVGPALARLSTRILQNALADAGQIDRLIKGLRTKRFAGDVWDALLQLGLQIARR
jgi:DNA polymerase-3 subunit delta